jgi:hypothetical protein
VNWGL